MSEVQTRPTFRGRGQSRGGRGGGFTTRSARGSHTSGGGGNNASQDALEDQGEVGQLKKQYSGQLSQLKDMFPIWTSEDLVFALKENQGDVGITATKITDGVTSQWDEVKKKTKDRSRSKVKEPSPPGADNDLRQTAPRARGGRGGSFGTRGGRGTETRGARGRGRNTVPNGARLSRERAEEGHPFTGGSSDAAMHAEAGTPEGDKNLTESSVPAWLEETKESESSGFPFDNSFASPDARTDSPRPSAGRGVTAVKSVAKPPATGSSWAHTLFPSTIPLPPAVVQKKPPPPKQAPVQPASSQQPVPESREPEPFEENITGPKELVPEVLPTVAILPPVEPTPAPVEPEAASEPETVPELPESNGPSAQPLTEVNLEKIENSAPPLPTMTQASTIASSVPPPIAPSVSVPPSQPPVTTPQPTVSRSAHPGVAMPKGTPGRGSSYRRVLDQQEGVVMPSNHGAVEHATLQFGSMGLNGDIDDEEELEQAETVSQPPQPSPIAQPVTSLPPTGPSQMPVSHPPITEALPTPRQAPGLPTHPHVAPNQPSPQPPVAPHSMTQHHQLGNQYGRYGGIPETQQSQAKAFDTFAHSAQQPVPPQPQTQPQPQPQQAQPQAYGSYGQSPLQPQQQPSHISVGVSTAAPEQQQQYNYYNDRPQPPGFGAPYNSNFMQQGQTQQDVGTNQQRAPSGLGGAGEGLGQVVPTSTAAPSQVQQQTSRYSGQGEQGSGHATPSPAIPAVQHTSQPHQPSLAQQYPGVPGYAYQQQHPYYSQFIPQSYYNQPGPFKNHQGMYAYPQYMTPQYSDHASSPAGLGTFGAPSAQGREGVTGLGDYSRMNTSSAQQQPQALPHASTGYGSNIPSFLNSRGLPQDQQQLSAGVGQQQVGQQGQADDALKFSENKPPTGPSGTPSIQGQPGRPGSATSNLGPQHGGQAPGSMYGSHLNHGLHGHQGQNQYGVGQQGQNAAAQYSVYSSGYPQYSQTSGRHSGAGGWGGAYSH